MRHVGEAEDAVIAVRVGVTGRDLAPVLVGRGELDLAAEVIGVGNEQRAFFAIELDRDVPVPRNVEAHGHRDRGAADEGQRPGDMRRDLDRNARSGHGLARDDALGPQPRRRPADARHRTEQIDEVGHVIGAHVEHRPAAVEVVEAGIGVPALMARTHEERRAADRAADQAVVDACARGLVRAAEERVRRAAEPQALRRRRLDQPTRFGDVDAERLFRVDMLAGGDRHQADLDMRLRYREVEDDFDRRIGEERVDRTRRRAELGRARLRRRRIGVGERDNVEDREFLRRGQIGRADVAAADDADADPFHHASPIGLSFADGRGSGGSPGSAVEIAQRHRRGAAHPVSLAPFAHDDVGYVREARRQKRGDRLAERSDEIAR